MQQINIINRKYRFSLLVPGQFINQFMQFNRVNRILKMSRLGTGRVWGKQIGFLIKIKSHAPGRAQEYMFMVVKARFKGLGFRFG